MKNKITAAILIGLIIIFYGCDYVEQPYTIPGPNGCTVATPVFTPRTSPVKKVLVEDVTGHKCGNCPRAAEAIAQLVVTYGDQVVALGLHSTLSLSFTSTNSTDTIINPSQKYTYDFTTTVATDVDQQFGVSTVGLPNGMVNRKDFGGGPVVGYSTWSSHVATELATPQQVDIQLKNFWNASDSSLCSFYFVEALTALSANYKICMFVMEDDMIHWQKDYIASPSTDLEFFIHKHVLRGSLNGSWGTAVNTTATIADGDSFIDGYSIKVNPASWNINNLYVVAFVYNDATYEVIQAEEVKMIP